MNISHKKIKTILNDTAKSLSFKLTEKEQKNLFDMFSSIQNAIEAIVDFEIEDDVEPTNFPNNNLFTTTMRDDEPFDFTLHGADIFNNTKEFKNGMVILNNVKK